VELIYCATNNTTTKSYVGMTPASILELKEIMWREFPQGHVSYLCKCKDQV